MNEEREIITRKQAKERGLKRYFTGKPCKHGHVAERSRSGNCMECAKIREISNEQRERRLAYQKAYDAKNKISKGKRRDYLTKQERRDYNKIYRKTEKYREQSRRRRESEKYKKTQSDYYRKYQETESRTKSRLKSKLGFNPPEELVKAVHANRLIRRIIREQKQNQTTNK